MRIINTMRWIRNKAVRLWRALVSLAVVLVGVSILGVPVPQVVTLPDHLTENVGCVLDDAGNWVSFDLISGEYHKPTFVFEKNETKLTATSSPSANRFIGQAKDAPCIFWDGGSLDQYSDQELLEKSLAKKDRSLVEKAYAAISFNARTDQVDFGDNYDFDTSDTFSLSIWVNITATADCGIIWSKAETASALVSWDLLQNCSGGSGNVDFRVGDIASANRTECRFNNGQALDDGEWHHIVATYNGAAGCSNVTGYIDGVSRSLTQDFGGSTSGGHTLSMTLGAEAYGSQNQAIVGSVDEARIWSKVLTADEVKNTRWLRITDQEDLIGYWRLDEGVETTVFPYGSHASSSGVNGSFTSVDWVDSAPINYPR